jgi:hypothetical protein
MMVRRLAASAERQAISPAFALCGTPGNAGFAKPPTQAFALPNAPLFSY